MSAEISTPPLADWRAELPPGVTALPTAADKEIPRPFLVSPVLYEGIPDVRTWHEQRYERELARVLASGSTSAPADDLPPVVNFHARTGRTFTTRTPEEHIELLTGGQREKRFEAYEDTRRAIASKILNVFRKDV